MWPAGDCAGSGVVWTFLWIYLRVTIDIHTYLNVRMTFIVHMTYLRVYILCTFDVIWSVAKCILIYIDRVHFPWWLPTFTLLLLVVS